MNDMISLFNSMWIPLLLGIMCIGCGIYLAITGKPGIVRRRDDKRLLKDEKEFVKGAMILMFFMAVGCIIMAGIIYFTANDTIATIESITWFIVFAFLWKRNEDKNGAM